MKGPSILLLLLSTVCANNFSNQHSRHEECKNRFLSNTTTPTGLNFNITHLAANLLDKIAEKSANFSTLARHLLQQHNTHILGVLLSAHREEMLAFNVSNRLRIFPNRTSDTNIFWQAYNRSRAQLTSIGAPAGIWGVSFKTCHFPQRAWVNSYFFRSGNLSVGFFLKLQIICISEEDAPEPSGSYWCKCREGYFYPGANLSWKGFSGKDIESGSIDSPRCLPCPEKCDICESMCMARRDVYLKTAILCVQLTCMGITIIVALIVFKQRKSKAIATGMWTILETILLGIFILYSTVVVRFFEPSTLQCLLEPWAREVGFIICYGAIILKLYRHLIEFRTRKAHRWVVKDTDLLKYLLIMIMSVLAYMAAYTAITLNFLQENYSLLSQSATLEGLHYTSCKFLWWDYVTEIGELVILIFGIHLSYASRNARTQFHERSFLCAAISIELAVSTLYYSSRVLILPGLHPDIAFIIYCVRIQLSTTVTLVLVFIPKFWYQQKQVRSLAQEYSCRIPVDAFKDINAHGPLTGNNSDVDVGEVTLADMSPDDIRAELKRLYLQLEIFKSKTICRDNPHISKRRGGRKAQHRRFSLQNLHGKHRDKDKIKQQEEVTEAEPSRTPEDSVCSNEGPSAIYADLPSTTYTGSDHK